MLPVHLRGDVAELPALRRIADEAGAALVEDACHALGSRMTFDNVPAQAGDGRWGDDGGVLVPSGEDADHRRGRHGDHRRSADSRERLRLMRSHGMVRPRQAPIPGGTRWPSSGFNYRLPDMLCALGLSQLAKLPRFAERRRALARRYEAALAPLAPLVRIAARPAWSRSGAAPDERADRLRGRRRRPRRGDGGAEGARRSAARSTTSRSTASPTTRPATAGLDLPGADAWYARCLSLPLYPAMDDADVDRVAEALAGALGMKR